ncbi:hypothetical protein L1049_016286 [Liquidambar formosana]|uniref:F-box associated beta-propeller type 1 domain-containing protein n=1 Tax=Liquidambar formosana TaxID=63359 RepID=A0AAP0X0F0_LIQFO
MENPAEIYTLKTNSWKEIQRIPYDVCLYWGREGGTPVNGALYWQVIRPINFMDNFNNGALLRFDLMNEKFMLVPLPRDVAEEPMSSVGFPILSLGVFGGSLCIVQDHHETAVVIWALKEDDSSMDFFWSKLMTIPRMDGMQSNRFLAPICFTKNGEVLMNVRQKSPSGLVSRENEFYLYNPAEEKVTFKELLFRNIWFDYWNTETGYLQSLISHSGWNGDTGYIDDTGYIECLISPNGVGHWK